MMSNAATHTDVLIVGAGPVGLFLANDCARRGLRYRIVEARRSQSEHSKALAIFPRTLEIFDMAGIAAPFLQAANRVTSVAVITHGRSIAHMRFAPEESPYRFIAMVPQDVTERLLVEALRKRGGAVEYQTEFVSAAQADEPEYQHRVDPDTPEIGDRSGPVITRRNGDGSDRLIFRGECLRHALSLTCG